MDHPLSYDELMTNQRKERREVLAETQKMKHSIPKGDKKKKKEITAEIAQMLLDLDVKHAAEFKEIEGKINSPNLVAVSVADKLTDQPMPEEDTIVKPSPDDSFEKDTSIKAGRLSKAQRRRNQKAQAMKEREKAIAEQEVKNLSGSRYLEFADLKKKLDDRHLIIYEIPADGNCLYKAIEHQRSILDLEVIPVQILRELTSEHLLAKKDEYQPFLINPYGGGGVISDEMYLRYCEDVRKTSAWGGHIEIQALSQVCGNPIEVVQANAPSVIVGDEFDSPKLIISYHQYAFGLGEHYNSIISG